MPYRSTDEKHNRIQIGAGWTILGGTPPTPIPERMLDGIPGFLTWMSLLVSIAAAVAFPRTLLLIAALLGLYSSLRFLIAGVANIRGLRKIARWSRIDWQQRYADEQAAGQHQHALPWDAVRHIVIIPNYKEPLALLQHTLDILAAQNEAREKLHVVLAMEAGEEESARKAAILVDEYESAFAGLYYTIHPRGLPGEMQCKSANEAWAARWIKRHLVDELGNDIDHICVTTMDADTQWHPRYFDALTYLFATDTQRHNKFWQAPIRYHGKIWQINPLLRIVNAYATALELAYLAASWWRAMPMSSYSLSLSLLHRSGYWDPDVIADEWHMFIKAYFAQDGQVRVEPLMLPFIADATIGDNLLDELVERYQQSLRHAWGSKEVGYMVAKMIDHPEIRFLPSLRLLVRISHDILLASAGWIILTIGSQLPVLLHPQIALLQPADLQQRPEAILNTLIENVTGDFTWFILLFAGLLVVVLGAVFWYQDVIVRPPRDTRMTPGEFFWTLLSFPMLPVLTLFVVALPTLQAQTRLLLGIPLQFRVSRKV